MRFIKNVTFCLTIHHAEMIKLMGYHISQAVHLKFYFLLPHIPIPTLTHARSQTGIPTLTDARSQTGFIPALYFKI